MRVQEAWDLFEGTDKGKVIWKQTINQRGFACAHDGAIFEIVQEGEYSYKLTKFDPASNPIDYLQNPAPLPSELTVRGHHCDKYGNILDEVDVPPLSSDSPQAYILIRLYNAARESASIGARTKP